MASAWTDSGIDWLNPQGNILTKYGMAHLITAAKERLNPVNAPVFHDSSYYIRNEISIFRSSIEALFPHYLRDTVSTPAGDITSSVCVPGPNIAGRSSQVNDLDIFGVYGKKVDSVDTDYTPAFEDYVNDNLIGWQQLESDTGEDLSVFYDTNNVPKNNMITKDILTKGYKVVNMFNNISYTRVLSVSTPPAVNEFSGDSFTNFPNGSLDDLQVYNDMVSDGTPLKSRNWIKPNVYMTANQEYKGLTTTRITYQSTTRYQSFSYSSPKDYGDLQVRYVCVGWSSTGSLNNNHYDYTFDNLGSGDVENFLVIQSHPYSAGFYSFIGTIGTMPPTFFASNGNQNYPNGWRTFKSRGFQSFAVPESTGITESLLATLNINGENKITYYTPSP